MNYYAARELQGKDGKSGGWHYTCRNDGRIWPVGHCAEHEPHTTQAEAYECWTNYLLSNRLRVDGHEANVKRPCGFQGCEEWTQGYAEVDMRIFHLCDTHRTAEVVRQLFGTAGDAISSF